MNKILVGMLLLGSIDAFAENQVDRILKNKIGKHSGYNNQTGNDCGIVIEAPLFSGDEHQVTLYSSLGTLMLSSNDFKISTVKGLIQLKYKSTSGGGLGSAWGSSSSSSTAIGGLIRFNKMGSMIELVATRGSDVVYCEL